MREFYRAGQHGAFPDRPDFRDFSFVAGAAVVDWNKGFELDFKPKIENQNGSLSCVGQTFSKYAEFLNYYDTKEVKDLSAKFIYEQIYLPQGGAMLRDAVKILINKGVAEESLCPSYDNGNPPSEAFMRQQTITQAILDNALQYEGKGYYQVQADIDQFALAIQAGYGMAFSLTGSNPGWQTAYPIPPKVGETSWGHAILGVGFKTINNKKYIKFMNWWGEWGEGGYGYLSEDYFKPTQTNAGLISPVDGGWVVLDKPNMQILKTADSPNCYAILNGKKVLLIDFPTLQAISDGTVSTVPSIDYPEGGTLVWTERIIN